MATFEFRFPDVGEGIHEGTIVGWKVKEGDTVTVDQVLGEVETDKAVVEIPSPKAGKILRLHAVAGGTIRVGETMVTFEVKGEAAQSVTQKQAAKPPQPAKGEEAGGVVGFLPGEDTLKRAAGGGGALAAPAVRKLAADFGVALAAVAGTGAYGHITEEDVMKAAKAGAKAPSGAAARKAAAAAVPATAPSTPPRAQETAAQEAGRPKVVKKYDFWGYVEHVPLKGMRKTIAEHMEAAWGIPTVWHMDEADVTELAALREREKAKAQKQDVHLTYLPYIVKALVAALQKYPRFNATLDRENGDIIVKKYYNIGIAVDTGEGLIVPVVKGAEKKDLYALAKEIAGLAERAKSRKIDLAELKGGSFTITNIGILGGSMFTPIINAPEAAILGVGKMQDKAVAIDGKVVIRRMLPLVVGFDHRVVDGAEAARFLNDVIAGLQEPKGLK